MRVDVRASGAITLDDAVSCDGFAEDYSIRVQTHVHTDHMCEFNSSKGVQDILVSHATLELLYVEYNADLPIRSNILPIHLNHATSFNNCQLRLLDNGHMLGSVQVELLCPDGFRCGYSGDFAWPLDEVIEVDELVLDSTYGSPASIRKYTQQQANNRFIELVVDRLRAGPVFIRAHRSTLQRAISCLDDAVKNPIITSSRLFEELEVYKRYGYSLTKIYDDSTEEASMARSDGSYIRLFETRERMPSGINKATSIILSAYMNRLDDPVFEYSEKSYCVALSDHADYNETLEYVRATGAKKVMTDNSRGGHGVELALALRRELGIDAVPSKNKYVRAWGR